MLAALCKYCLILLGFPYCCAPLLHKSEHLTSKHFREKCAWEPARDVCTLSALWSGYLCVLSEYECIKLNRSILCSSKILANIIFFWKSTKTVDLRMRLENRILEILM